MTTDTNANSHRSPSYWKVGLALLALVVVLLVGAFLLNHQLRPRVGVAPAATISGTTPHPTSGLRGRTSTSTAQPAIATATSTRVGPTARPTPTPTPRQALMQAYHRYWQNYTQALYTLDPSHMGEVATGAELRRVQAEVAGFRRRNDAVRVRVTHHALIVSIKGDTATIYDEVLNRSFLIDPITKQPPHGSNQADLEKNIYSLKKIDGAWKVTKVLRQKG